MPNRLAQESSPYLRQHADDPVDWWPWGDEALALARAQDKPILLSIGYSACHWCHVMAHESFEDAATAAVMNELYVCIKVDREERPDLDKIYQLAHQALTQRGGGWPLTVFLTPDDHLPFYAGTYFPKDARYGMPPFAHVLRQVRSFWDTRRDDVRRQNAALGEFLREYDGTATATDEALDDAPIRLALARSAASFDATHGGHRGAPKFPHCPELELLRDLDSRAHRNADDRDGAHSAAQKIADPKTIVDVTLTRMAEGGIHDQIGGGFCRYSVDERWEIPHFEKMLYDNAQLLPLYAEAAADPLFRRSALALVDWLRREMTAPSGAFYSALDADSEHEEGKFYVWQRDEVRALLDADEFAVAERVYGFDRAPNFEQHAWNPIVAAHVTDVAAALGIPPEQAATLLESACRKLFAARSQRVRPGLDDKILTAWNALMICGLARAARSLRDASLLHDAERALAFLHDAAWRGGRLFAKTGADSARFPAYLDDHAFLLDALLEMLQSRWNDRGIAWAIALADALLDRFEDRERGGFFFTAHDHEQLIQRSKSWPDEAVPSGNGVAARALLRLGHLIGET
ncbi:MAG TPA: thioredoxin domain-containing protein, partial [Rudaea sp.]